VSECFGIKRFEAPVASCLSKKGRVYCMVTNCYIYVLLIGSEVYLFLLLWWLYCLSKARHKIMGENWNLKESIAFMTY
jgi:hypothetical protein